MPRLLPPTHGLFGASLLSAESSWRRGVRLRASAASEIAGADDEVGKCCAPIIHRKIVSLAARPLFIFVAIRASNCPQIVSIL